MAHVASMAQVVSATTVADAVGLLPLWSQVNGLAVRKNNFILF
jgi:hypothetical protein